MNTTIQHFFFALYDMTCRKRKRRYLNILGKPGNPPKSKLYGRQIGTKFNYNEVNLNRGLTT